MADEKIMKDIKLNDPVSITLPAHAWIGFIAASRIAMAAIEQLCHARTRTTGGELPVMKRAIAGAALALAAMLTAACGGTGPSAACQKATAAQNAYVLWVETNTTYPNDNPSEGFNIMAHDAGLLQKMKTAGCPDNTRINVLPSS